MHDAALWRRGHEVHDCGIPVWEAVEHLCDVRGGDVGVPGLGRLVAAREEELVPRREAVGDEVGRDVEAQVHAGADEEFVGREVGVDDVGVAGAEGGVLHGEGGGEGGSVDGHAG